MDFINIPVDYAIEPAQTRLGLGGIVCFHTPIISDRGKYAFCCHIVDKFIYFEVRPESLWTASRNSVHVGRLDKKCNVTLGKTFLILQKETV